MNRPKWTEWVPEICPKCGEIRALTVGEVNKDPLIPDFIKELIVPLLKDQRELQRLVAGAIELAYLRGRDEGQESATPNKSEEAMK